MFLLLSAIEICQYMPAMAELLPTHEHVLSITYCDICGFEWKSIIQAKYPTGRVKTGTFRPQRSSSVEETSPRLMKTFEVETSWVFTLPVAYFARIIDFRS